MKKIALSVAALVLTAGSALAADLPSRKGPPMLPPPPPPPLWTGFYVGLNAGYTWANNNTTTVTTFPLFPTGGVSEGLAALASGVGTGGSDSGFIGGGQIGYNWQFYNSFLVGAEADIQGIAGSGSSGAGLVTAGNIVGVPVISNVSGTKSLDYLGTVRGRLGWLSRPPCSFTARAVSPMAARAPRPTSSRPATMATLASAPPASPTPASAGRPAAASSGCSGRAGRPRSNICITTSAPSPSRLASSPATLPRSPRRSPRRRSARASMVTSSAPASTITSTGALRLRSSPSTDQRTDRSRSVSKDGKPGPCGRAFAFGGSLGEPGS